MLGSARRLPSPAGPRPPMSPAGLRSLARSRRPAQNRPGAPEPGAGRPRAAKEAEHSRSGACLCLHGFSPLWHPRLPLFPATSVLGCPLIPETVIGEDPILSYHREKAILPLLNAAPGPGLGPPCHSSQPLVKSKGVTLSPGSQAWGCAAFSLGTVACSTDTGGGGLHTEVKFTRQRASAWVSACGRQRAHAHVFICSSCLVAWVFPLCSVI